MKLPENRQLQQLNEKIIDQINDLNILIKEIYKSSDKENLEKMEMS